MTVAFVVDGLKDARRYFDALPDLATDAAFFAVNDTLRDEEVAVRRQMEVEINFPRGYLKGNRYGIGKRASRSRLEGSLIGRDRPTSLARFAEGATRENTRGKQVIVRVRGGQRVSLRRAFLIELRNNNIGLAIRLPDGQRPDKAYKPVQLTQNSGKSLLPIWLLYGPSVDQVMSGVISDRTDEIQERLFSNFSRQFDRLSRRG